MKNYLVSFGSTVALLKSNLGLHNFKDLDAAKRKSEIELIGVKSGGIWRDLNNVPSGKNFGAKIKFAKNISCDKPAYAKGCTHWQDVVSREQPDPVIVKSNIKREQVDKRALIEFNNKLYLVYWPNSVKAGIKKNLTLNYIFSALERGNAKVLAVRSTEANAGKGSWLVYPEMVRVSTQEDRRFVIGGLKQFKTTRKDFEKYVTIASLTQYDAQEEVGEPIVVHEERVESISPSIESTKHEPKEESTILSLLEDQVFNEKISDAEFRGMFKMYVLTK